MLRDSQKQPEDNGVWLVFSETANLADSGIRKDFPSMRLIKRLGGKIAHWRLIPADSTSFESEALHDCELLLKHDVRFGRIPQSRRIRRSSSVASDSPRRTRRIARVISACRESLLLDTAPPQYFSDASEKSGKRNYRL